MGMKPRAGGRKAASKRLTCKMKYKIQKKVREHNRKERLAERTSPKLRKDPGVPNLHPFKEQLLQRAAEQKQQLAEQEARQREMRRAAASAVGARPVSALEALAANAQQRTSDFAEAADDLPAAMGAVAPDEVQNAHKFYREFKKVVEQADVVLEILDARDPIGSRSAIVETAVLAAGARKKLVLVLNKIDLVPREVVEGWLKYLRNEFPAIAFKASTQKQSSHLSQSKAPAIGGEGGSDCRGAQQLMKLLGNYSRNLDLKTAIRVGVVGYPNVGKSSVINSLKRDKACGVGAVPGFTRTVQEVQLSKNIMLLDSPGIVFSMPDNSDDLVLRNCVRVDSLTDPIKPVESILRRCNHYQLMEKYAVPKFGNSLEFLQHLARRLGKMKKGGVPDCEAAARSILQDWNAGRISFYTMPPETNTMATHVTASIKDGFGAAFDLEALMRDDAEILEGSTLREDDRGLALAPLAPTASAGGPAAAEKPLVTKVLPKSQKKRAAEAQDHRAKDAEEEEAAAAAVAEEFGEDIFANPEDDFTPTQTNRARKMAQKKQKKTQRRDARDASLLAAAAEPYDFGRDFGGAAAEDDDE